jgi:hypothetical protein
LLPCQCASNCIRRGYWRATGEKPSTERMLFLIIAEEKRWEKVKAVTLVML